MPVSESQSRSIRLWLTSSWSQVRAQAPTQPSAHCVMLSLQLASLHDAFHCGFLFAESRLRLWLSAALPARWSRISRPH